MKDRNGIEVRKGDRVLVFHISGPDHGSTWDARRVGYGRINEFDRNCSGCGVPEVAVVSLIGVPRPRGEGRHVKPSGLELPVTTAVVRRRECERQKRH